MFFSQRSHLIMRNKLSTHLLYIYIYIHLQSFDKLFRIGYTLHPHTARMTSQFLGFFGIPINLFWKKQLLLLGRNPHPQKKKQQAFPRLANPKRNLYQSKVHHLESKKGKSEWNKLNQKMGKAPWWDSSMTLLDLLGSNPIKIMVGNKKHDPEII